MKKEFLITLDEDTKEVVNSCLSDYDLEDLAALNDEVKKAYFDKLVNCQYDNNFLSVCPYCGNTHICKAGKNEKNEQRYKCVDCGKRFLNRSNSMMYWSRLSKEQWQILFYSTLQNNSLKSTSELLGVSITSTFYNRHKLLYVLVQLMNKDILSDVVELDETFITFQEQGYVKSGKRGLSADKLAITCAIDSQGHTVLSVGDRGRPLSETLISIFSEYIEEHCTLVSDSQRSYHQLVKALKVEWIKIESGDKEKSGYTLDRINQLHNKIKSFIHAKRNFMAHYMQGYLGLFQYVTKHNIMIGTRIFEFEFASLCKIISGIRNKDICAGQNMYRTFYKSSLSN